MKQRNSSSNRHLRQISRYQPGSLFGHRVSYRQSGSRAAQQKAPKSKEPNLTHHEHANDPSIAVPVSRTALQRQVELEQELQLARDIQQGLLLEAVPRLPGWELSAVSLPARDLGGDLYDFLPLHNGWQGIMIGDVSGKGLPAALRMAVARTVFRHEARRGESPAHTLAAVNRSILSEIPQGMVTMLYALLEPIQGVFKVANAGHTFPVLVNGNVQELELSGLPLGVDSDSDYTEAITVLNPGDSVLLYTDGLIEAERDDGAIYGYERLQAILAAHSRLKPRALTALLLNELRSWSSSTAQSDDVTMVVVRRRLARPADELHTIADDVLGEERATLFWENMGSSSSVLLDQVDPDIWIELLPVLTRAAQERFGRGLARELQQQLRLAIEDYRV